MLLLCATAAGDPTAALLAPSNASGVASDYAGGWWLTDTLNNAVRHILSGDVAGPDSLGTLAGCSILVDRWLLNCTLVGVSPLPPLWAYFGGIACKTLSQPVTLGAVITLFCPLPLASTNATALEWFTLIGRSSANVSVSLPTPTQTPSISLTASQTPTISDSSSQSGSFSASSSHTPSQSLTASTSPSQLSTPSVTPSQSPSVTPAAPGSTAVGFTIETIAGSPGVRGTSGNGGLALDALLTSPNAVAADGQGGVFVAESFGGVGVNTLRHVFANGTIVLVAGIPNRRGFTGDNGPATMALLNSPSGVRVASSGDILIADRKNGRIRCLFYGNASITTVAGTGRDDFSDGVALNASFSLPGDIALVPGSGGPSTWSYYVAVSWQGGSACAATRYSAMCGFPLQDTGNCLVRYVSSGVVTTVAGVLPGRCGWSADGGPALATMMNLPRSLDVDPVSGDVFIAGAREASRCRK